MNKKAPLAFAKKSKNCYEKACLESKRQWQVNYLMSKFWQLEAHNCHLTADFDNPQKEHPLANIQELVLLYHKEGEREKGGWD